MPKDAEHVIIQVQNLFDIYTEVTTQQNYKYVAILTTYKHCTT
jgi:hypothetical protein